MPENPFSDPEINEQIKGIVSDGELAAIGSGNGITSFS
jgi:hypothetical protein